MMKSALEIMKDTFNEREVRLARIMHVETNLLNSVRDVTTSKSGILESSS
jgi:hypothetical protein